MIWGASLVAAPYPREQWLQHIPTALSLPALWLAARRQWLSNVSSGSLCVLLVLHIVGARWIYSFVPYESWFEMLLGSGPDSWFQWERNHYDRFVHLMFGVLCITPVAEVACRRGGISRRWALTIAIGFVGAISAVYEVFEWMLAVIAAPNFADRYNGQQGDMWDAQKDMALALLGSLFTCLAVAAASFTRGK